MTPKKLTSSILRISKLFIPFYWIYNQSTKGETFHNQQTFDYKSSDIDNGFRGNLRLITSSGSMSLIYIVAVLWPPVTLGWYATLVVLGVGILPGIADFLTKQAIRGVSYWKHHKDTRIIRPTYPKKYTPSQHETWKTDSMEYKTECSTEDETTRRIMKALCLKKQAIKNDPETWSGLSEKQQKQCDVLNLAIKFYRHYPNKSIHRTNSFRAQELRQHHTTTLFVFFLPHCTTELNNCNKNNRMDPELKSSFLDPIIQEAIERPSLS